MDKRMRFKVARRLRDYRKKVGKTAAEVAAELGWTVATYEGAEAGTVGLSTGQVADVRRVLIAALQAATVRDRLRDKRPARIPIIGGGFPRKQYPAGFDPVSGTPGWNPGTDKPEEK